MNLNQALPLVPIHMAIAPTPHKTFDLFLPPLPNPHNGLNFIEMIGIELTPN